MNYTENLSLGLPEYGENADVAALNRNSGILDAYVYNTRQMQAPPYDPDRDPAYSTGEIVTQNSALYICNTDGTTGPWDATKWDSTTLSKQIELAKQSGVDYLTVQNGMVCAVYEED